MRSAKNVADAASRLADAELSSLGSVFTCSLQAPGQEAKRVCEATYLAGLDPLGNAQQSRSTTSQ